MSKPLLFTKLGILSLVFLITLSSLAQAGSKTTIEEDVLFQNFSAFIIAQTYDKFCQDGKIVSTPPKKEVNLYWYGNQQTLLSMLAAILKRRYPQDTIEQSIKRLKRVENAIIKKTEGILTEKGCHSPEAASIDKVLQAFVSTPPWGLHGSINKEIRRKGGSITILTEKENHIVPDKNPQP